MDSRFQMNMYSDMTYFSCSSSNSFFYRQALRVGITGNEFLRSEYVRDAPNARIEFLCEPEKKQTREGIIAGEIVPKWELEAEVRRDILLMERELALQRPEGFPLMAPSSSSLMHYPCNRRVDKKFSSFDSVEYGAFNRMPFQRHPEALMPKAKSIPKPNSMNPNLSKTKREVEVPATAVSCERPVVSEWSCALCQVSATCEQGLKDHLQGKKHRKAASQLKARKTGQKLKGKKEAIKKGKKKRISHVRVEKNSASNRRRRGKRNRENGAV